jgi:hypothetical protein
VRPLYAMAEVAPIARRGSFGGCGCCAAPMPSVCDGSQIANTAGCCSTNALGWAVAAEWALG